MKPKTTKARARLASVSFDDWESGRVKLSDERFDPTLGEVLGHTWENEAAREHRRVVGYRGGVTGTRVGTWFAEVMEPEANATGERPETRSEDA